MPSFFYSKREENFNIYILFKIKGKILKIKTAIQGFY
tara:strand:- start:434 stop:544 length:111 start_codon:yes stop_codon:yes gene_type:complete